MGGGFVGLHAALRLERRLNRNEAQITLVSTDSFMTYQPFLPEAAAGNLEPRHVVVPLRAILKRSRVLVAEVTAVDPTRKIVTAITADGHRRELPYDEIVLAVGSVSRTLRIPGLDETGIGFKTLPEAIHLRNHVIARLDAAETATEESVRRRALTFVFVGGGYAGVEALAELEDLARDAAGRYHNMVREDMRWVLVEAGSTILPEMAPGAAEYSIETLRKRGVEVLLNTTLVSAEGGKIRLSNGDQFDAGTLVWTAGVKADPLTAETGFEIDDRGRIVVDEFMRVKGVEGAWAAGDCAAVPDLVTGGICPPTAQYAVRQARRLAANLVAVMRDRAPAPFRYRNLGGLASLGRYKGVAAIMRLRLKGFPAWLVHRSYHLFMIPTFGRRVRIVADWTLALFFRRDIVQLGSLQRPFDAFEESAGRRRSDNPGQS